MPAEGHRKVDAGVLAEARRQVAAGSSRLSVARRLGVSKSTLYRHVARAERGLDPVVSALGERRADEVAAAPVEVQSPGRAREEAEIAEFLARRDCRVPGVGDPALTALCEARPLVMDAKTKKMTRRPDAVPIATTYGNRRFESASASR